MIYLIPVNITASETVSSEHHCRICLPFIISTINYLQHINHLLHIYLLPITCYLLPATCHLLHSYYTPTTLLLPTTTYYIPTTYNLPPT